MWRRSDTAFQPAAPSAKVFGTTFCSPQLAPSPKRLASLFEVRFANQCFNIVRALAKSKAENSFAIERPHWRIEQALNERTSPAAQSNFVMFTAVPIRHHWFVVVQLRKARCRCW